MECTGNEDLQIIVQKVQPIPINPLVRISRELELLQLLCKCPGPVPKEYNLFCKQSKGLQRGFNDEIIYSAWKRAYQKEKILLKNETKIHNVSNSQKEQLVDLTELNEVTQFINIADSDDESFLIDKISNKSNQTKWPSESIHVNKAHTPSLSNTVSIDCSKHTTQDDLSGSISLLTADGNTNNKPRPTRKTHSNCSINSTEGDSETVISNKNKLKRSQSYNTKNVVTDNKTKVKVLFTNNTGVKRKKNSVDSKEKFKSMSKSDFYKFIKDQKRLERKEKRKLENELQEKVRSRIIDVVIPKYYKKP